MSKLHEQSTIFPKQKEVEDEASKTQNLTVLSAFG
jgi:hypothetical protein